MCVYVFVSREKVCVCVHVNVCVCVCVCVCTYFVKGKGAGLEERIDVLHQFFNVGRDTVVCQEVAVHEIEESVED